MVAEDIKLTLFAPQCGGTPEVHFSPDGKYFAVWTERGILERVVQQHRPPTQAFGEGGAHIIVS